ncbi:MAG TPA: response regulator [Nitrososphaeraceae archaeon]|nr:response regulator [Nitrososphaeraceae archaeon]
MTLYCKSKLLCEYPQYYDNNKGVLFSPPPLRSFYLPYYKLLYGSVSSSFERINSHKSVVTTTNTAAQFSDSIPTNNEHILLVDDEEDIARLFKRALERAGFIVDMYNDPLQSLSNYRTGIYDLLLLDIKMPEMNGFELYKRIKQIDDNSKVCFMTAFEEYYDEFREIFPDLKDKECFIRKPISINDLIKSVKSHLNYPRDAQ